MTPKEKAKEFYDKYEFVYIQNYTSKHEVIQCCIIAVDEILAILRGLHKPEYCGFDAIGERQYTYNGEYDDLMTGYDMVDYYNEVKTELTNL